MNAKKVNEPALCFVPEMLVEYMNKNNIIILEPASFFMHGVCLLVDISGFTKLSGQFCDQGKAGIDNLQLATNGFMGQLVEIIYKFGGDIIKFAGDAIICVFSPENTSSNNTDRPVRRSSVGSFASFAYGMNGNVDNDADSVACSVAINTPSSISAEVILRVMHCAKLLTDVQTDKLTVHVAMSCGEMCFGILGGFENRWECLISGPCIHQLSDCLDDAPSKHAVLSRKSARILKISIAAIGSGTNDLLSADYQSDLGNYEFSIQPLPSGNYRIVTVDFTAAKQVQHILNDKIQLDLEHEWNNQDVGRIVKQFVPVPIAEQLDRGASLHYMAEIREVTTMFMKWDSYDENTKHRDLLELQPCFYQAQRILASTGAYLRQFLVDDKGCVLIACWGMPHLSYLDNAHRALTAAAQIRIACYQLEMNCSFGITTGEVYCGTVGSALRMEYAAIGSCVNMSARLMGKANGGILIDDATYEHFPPQAASSVQKMNPIKVKGRDEPLQVYSYIESGTFSHSMKVSGDEDMPQYCRQPLQALLANMTQDSSKISVHHATEVTAGCSSLLTGWFKPPPPMIRNLLSILLIEGKEGSGRTSVVTWLKNQATEYTIPTCAARLSKKDTLVSYALWKKLFLQLMPKDLFLNNKVQRTYVQELLRKVYPKQGRTQGFSALRVLGITCSMQDGTIRATLPGQSENPVKNQFVWNEDSERSSLTSNSRINNGSSTLAKHIFIIFAYLLCLHPTLLIVEGLELADENSLRLLLELSKLPTRSSIVCTALLETKEALSFPQRDNKKLHVGNTAWTRQFRIPLLQLPSTTLITLENYSPEEIDQLLCAAMDVVVVPAHVSQLVRDFSGGSYFWVREILQFIKEHGAEHFLMALGESEVVNPANTSSQVRSRTLSISCSGRIIGLSATIRNMNCQDLFGEDTPITPFQKQVDNLLLVRFGNLTPEEQRILRKSSIIGVSFAKTVIFVLLSPHLQVRLSECLSSLVAKRWLYRDFENNDMYLFAHAHARQVVYELTPPSERNVLHQLVAEHLVNTRPDDCCMYFPLWYHFQHCNEDLALQYAVKAAAVMLETEDIFEYGDCLDMLRKSISCCKTIYDIYVLQQLMNMLHNRIAEWTVECNVTPPRRQSLFSWLLSTPYKVRVVPDKPSTRSSITSTVVQSYRRFGSLSGRKQGAEEDADEVVDDTMKTKIQLIEQVERFRHFLSSKSIGLLSFTDASCSAGENAAQSGDRPTEWQRVMLNIPGK